MRLLIFDFDGVLADSELLANAVLAQAITELGVPTTTEDSLLRYMGKRFHDVIAAVEHAVGQPLPPDFPTTFQQRTLARFKKDLRLVEGACAYIDAFPAIPRCIASSSSPDRLSFCLDLLNLTDAFGANVFSASQVARGKPHPDIFLYAAEQMRTPPSEALVIEDSIGGVQAATAAGMTVIGLLAASHIRDGHAARLRAAGARYIATTFAQAEDITRLLISHTRGTSPHR
jgi:HAD superfamily hydrolase (TIGR01509 family)